MKDLLERFTEKVTDPYDAHNDCWVWSGELSHNWYGRFWINNKRVPAHRVSYELFVGPVPEGHSVDHMCRCRMCVRPDHLQTLLHSEHMGQFNRGKTHCKNGHPYDDMNTYWLGKEMRCKICYKEHQRRWKEGC